MRPHVNLRNFSGGLSLRPAAPCGQGTRPGRNALVIEVNAEPTPLTERMISDYLIQGKTGQILPQIVEEVKKLQPF